MALLFLNLAFNALYKLQSDVDADLMIYPVSKPNFLTVLLNSNWNVFVGNCFLEQSLKFIVDADYLNYFSIVVVDGCIMVSHRQLLFVTAVYGWVELGASTQTQLCCIQLLP